MLSFQHFGPPDRVEGDFRRWQQLSGMPILLADGSGSRKLPDGTAGQDGRRYAKTLEVLRANPGCIGFHLCGAYLTNRVRRKGLRTEREQPDTEAVELIKKANEVTTKWAASFERA